MNDRVNELVEAGAADSADPRKVFVIYGRNRAARAEIFTFLRALGLEPIEWETAVRMTGQASPYVGDVLAEGLKAAQAVVVLQTPDDVVYLDGDLCEPDDPDGEGQPQGQPRPNVFYEAGMAMAVSRDRTVIVEFGRVKTFSDISGRHVVRLDNTPQKRQTLATRLRDAGCSVNLDGADWYSAGDLTPPIGPGRGRPLGKKLPESPEPKHPKLDGRHRDRGGRSIGAIEIINHGPGDVLDLDVDLPDGGRGFLRNNGNLPLRKLPEGKSAVVLDYLGGRTFGENASTLTINAVGKTEDGESFEQEIFISL
ncbi:nucleotide-binding protein [Nocardia nova]|uniref:nucleotide-binding protein n=1 Tax=Nocardia nova TaxID=37330 RepID=UPI0033EBC8A4